jgi:GT2 family glycosyltransferase
MIYQARSKSHPDCSIIIPNLHSPIIDRTIQSIFDQDTDFSYEIIVVGMDKYKKIPIDDVTFMKTLHPTPPAIARNMGASIANGEFIFFLDADCIADPKWVNEHFDVHRNQDAPVVVGGGVSFPGTPFLTLTDNVSTFHEYMTHNPKSERLLLPSLNLSVPKSVWDELGGFDESFPYASGEDSDFAIRAHQHGYKLIFTPYAVVEHLPERNNLPKILSHAFRFGEYSIKGNRKYWDILSLPWPMKHWISTLLLSPLASLYIIFRMVFIEKLPIEYWHTIPIVFFLKVVWCKGFAKNLLSQKSRN